MLQRQSGGGPPASADARPWPGPRASTRQTSAGARRARRARRRSTPARSSTRAATSSGGRLTLGADDPSAGARTATVPRPARLACRPSRWPRRRPAGSGLAAAARAARRAAWRVAGRARSAVAPPRGTTYGRRPCRAQLARDPRQRRRRRSRSASPVQSGRRPRRAAAEVGCGAAGAGPGAAGGRSASQRHALPRPRPRRSSTTMVPPVTRTSAPSASACAEERTPAGAPCCRRRAKPVRSSRLTCRRASPRAAARRGAAPRASAARPARSARAAPPARAARGAGDDQVDHLAAAPGGRAPARRPRASRSRSDAASVVAVAAPAVAQGVVQSGLRRVLAQPRGEHGERLLAAGPAVEVGAASPRRRPPGRRRARPRSRSRCAVSRHTSGSATHSAFQLRPSRSCGADHPLDQHAGRCPGEPGQGVQVLAALGVALVRHGDAADDARAGWARAARRSPAAAARRPRGRSGPACRRPSRAPRRTPRSGRGR